MNPCRPGFVAALLGGLLACLPVQAQDDRSNTTPVAWSFIPGTSFDLLLPSGGYRPIDLNVEQQTPTSPILFSAVSVFNDGVYGKAWWYWVGVDAEFVQARLDQDNGRLIDIEPYAGRAFLATYIPNVDADQKNWWWYPNTTLADIEAKRAQNNARLTVLKSYFDGSQRLYTAVMIANTGADAKGSWYYDNVTPAQITAYLAQNKARLVAIQSYGSGTFTVIMEALNGEKWSWYTDKSPAELNSLAAASNSRIIDVAPYFVNGNRFYAGIMLQQAGVVNPSPTLNSISPSLAAARSAAFTLTVNGANFVPGSVVQWNEQPLATVFINSTQLTATVPGLLLFNAGRPTVSVRNPAPGGGASSNAYFTILDPVTQRIITTAAGADWVFNGDGNVALKASLGGVQEVATDQSDNVYLSDCDNSVVDKVTPDGKLTVIAGNGLFGYSGDGGSAKNASLNCPRGLAVAGNGDLYISDAGNQRIRKVSAAGTITTVAGNGVAGYSGDGGAATSAMIANPQVISLDNSGNLYIADRDNHRIRRVGTNGFMTTIAGNGQAAYTGDGGLAVNAALLNPEGLFVDAGGSVYIADSGNNRLRRVSPSGIITTIAGNGNGGVAGDGGQAINAAIGDPTSVSVDAVGNIYVTQYFDHVVRRITAAGIITTFAGTPGKAGFRGDGGPASAALLSFPLGVSIDRSGSGIVYVAEQDNQRVRKIAANGIISTYAGNGAFEYAGDGGPAVAANLRFPSGVAFDSLGNLYIADRNNQHVRTVNTQGVISTLAGAGPCAYGGDGGLAVQAFLCHPNQVATDRSGNIYISDSDNNRVRKVLPNGTIVTVAGTGDYTYSGDGGPAVNAALASPWAIAVDSAGNLYIADRANHRVRKVNTSGIISTVAGNGIKGFSGDGGPGTQAQLNSPAGLAIDAANNLYISDRDNHRIRKLTPSGAITTIVGTGDYDIYGDGGPALNAALEGVEGIAMDSAGNLYIADYDAGLIRMVTAAGIISTLAGGGSISPGDGNAATNVGLGGPTAVTVDNAGNVYIAESFTNRIRKVLAISAAPSYSVSSTKLTFSAISGGQASDPQAVSLSSGVVGLQWSAVATTSAGGNWLILSTGGGNMPGNISVSASPLGLAAGTYLGVITITAPLASNPVQTVAVQFVVAVPIPASLSVDPPLLTFQGTVGTSDPPAQTLRIGNSGSGTLAWQLQATTGSGNWLRASLSTGSSNSGSPTNVQISAGVAGLAAGAYAGTILVTSPSTGQSVSVGVTLLLTSAQNKTIFVSQTGLTFVGVEGGSVIPPQTFGILNGGAGSLDWTVQPQTLSGGNWLSASPPNGTSVANSLTVPLVTIGVNTIGLPAGKYSGQIQVKAPGATNSPQNVGITLVILPAGSPPPPIVRPTGLIFVTTPGNSPGSQTVSVATATPGSFVAKGRPYSYSDNVPNPDWLGASFAAPFSIGSSGKITVQPNTASFAPGQYLGFVPVGFQDGTSTQVAVLLVVVSPGRGVSAQSLRHELDTTNCSANKLYLTSRSLPTSGYLTPVGLPAQIQVQVMDNCNNSVNGAAVTASFNNGLALGLVGLGSGLYEASWSPSQTSSGSVTITIRAQSGSLAADPMVVPVSLSGNTATAGLYSGGVVNGASFDRKPLTPGAIASLFGVNLGTQPILSPFPLPSQQDGVSVTVGGVTAPLFFSGTGQLNAQIPFELPPNSTAQVMVNVNRTGQTFSTQPEPIVLTTAQPGIFNNNGQGAILNAATSVAVDSSHPVTAGNFISIFATGLGLTDVKVATGQKSPVPPANVVVPVQCTIGGKAATVTFAGLAPGYVGLYQVNVQIPQGLQTGNSVPLTLTQNGALSNTVTLAIR